LTIGVEFSVKHLNLNDKRHKVVLWDPSGNERFRPIVGSYNRGAHGFLIVYDITNKQSFQTATIMYQEKVQFNDPLPPSILVGNKCDLEEKRQVDTYEAEKWACDHGMGFMEVSAKTGRNVKELWENFVRKIMADREI